jgi:uncharacterized protein YndB with AHSA1/START domain
MKKTLIFTIKIRAPRQLVWEKMLGKEGFEKWTSAFCEGSTFSGSWDKGAKIQFLAPNGDGMTAVIAENRLHEYVSIRHLGEIHQGVEDTTSEKVRAWAPAYENYTFIDTEEGTRVTVHLDTIPEYEGFMMETFPKALELLKTLCELGAGTGDA